MKICLLVKRIAKILLCHWGEFCSNIARNDDCYFDYAIGDTLNGCYCKL